MTPERLCVERLRTALEENEKLHAEVMRLRALIARIETCVYTYQSDGENLSAIDPWENTGARVRKVLQDA